MIINSIRTLAANVLDAAAVIIDPNPGPSPEVVYLKQIAEHTAAIRALAEEQADMQEALFGPRELYGPIKKSPSSAGASARALGCTCPVPVLSVNGSHYAICPLSRNHSAR